MQDPLSRDEQAAMARYLSGIRQQLRDVCDLFTARYGNNSNIAEMAAKALVSSTLLEHEVHLLEQAHEHSREEELAGLERSNHGGY